MDALRPDLLALPAPERRAVAAALEGAFALLDRARGAARALAEQGGLAYGAEVGAAHARLAAALRLAPSRADVCTHAEDAWAPSAAAWFAAAGEATRAALALMDACEALAVARERDLDLAAPLAA